MIQITETKMSEKVPKKKELLGDLTVYCANVGELMRLGTNVTLDGERWKLCVDGTEMTIKQKLVNCRLNPTSAVEDVDWLNEDREEELNDEQLKNEIVRLEHRFGMNLADSVKDGRVSKVCINIVNSDDISNINKAKNLDTPTMQNSSPSENQTLPAAVVTSNVAISNQAAPVNEISSVISISNKIQLFKPGPKTNRNENGLSVYCCSAISCNVKDTSKFNVMDHEVRKHHIVPDLDTMTHFCPLCLYQTNDLKQFMTHQLGTHFKALFVCHKCNTRLVSHHHLALHLVSLCSYDPLIRNLWNSHENTEEPSTSKSTTPNPIGAPAAVDKHSTINVKKSACSRCKCQHIVGRYTCRNCSFATSCPKELEDHMSSKHRSTHIYHCPACGFNTKSYHRIELHLLMKHNDHQVDEVSNNSEPELVCIFCDNQKKFPNECALKEHFSSEHIKTSFFKRPYSCHVCEFKCVTDLTLRNHCWDLHKRSISLENCDKKALKTIKPVIHQMYLVCFNSSRIKQSGAAYSRQKKPQVQTCKKKVIEVPVGSEPDVFWHYCGLCGMVFKDFTSQTNIKRHMLKHVNIEPYRCGVCQKAFKTNNNAVLHFNRSHPGIASDIKVDGPFLVAQKKKITELLPCITRRISEKDAPEKYAEIYSCSLCPVTSTQKAFMKEHMKTHGDTGSSNTPRICVKPAPNRSHKLTLKNQKKVYDRYLFPIVLPDIILTKRDEMSTYKCKNCSHTMRLTKQVEEHILEVHLDHCKPQRCAYCLYEDDEVMLKFHEKMHPDASEKIIIENEVYWKCWRTIQGTLRMVDDTCGPFHTSGAKLVCNLCEPPEWRETSLGSMQFHYDQSHPDKQLNVSIIFPKIPRPSTYFAHKDSKNRKGKELMNVDKEPDIIYPENVIISKYPYIRFVSDSYKCPVHVSDVTKCSIFFCNLCDYVVDCFEGKKDLKKHWLVRHVIQAQNCEITPYSCMECGHKELSTYKLKIHLRKLHKKGLNDSMLVDEKAQRLLNDRVDSTFECCMFEQEELRKNKVIIRESDCRPVVRLGTNKSHTTEVVESTDTENTELMNSGRKETDVQEDNDDGSSEMSQKRKSDESSTDESVSKRLRQTDYRCSSNVLQNTWIQNDIKLKMKCEVVLVDVTSKFIDASSLPKYSDSF